MSDHFQHQDKSITNINFLRYFEKEWERIAGNEFAYCNRLRVSDYFALFKELGFDVCRCDTKEDDEVRQSLVDGFTANDKFREYSVDDLCVTQIKVALNAVAKEDWRI